MSGHTHGQRGNRKKIKNSNQQSWQWNDAIILGEKETPHDRMTRGNNKGEISKNEWNGINEINFRKVSVKYYNNT